MKKIYGVEIVTTADWGAKPPAGAMYFTTPDKIILHHMATPNPPSNISRGNPIRIAQACQRWHLGRRWVDTGQHFTVSSNGTILEGRTGSLSVMLRGKCLNAAHCVGQNGQWGIEVEGTFISERPSDGQIEAIVDICAIICIKCGIDSSKIFGHRDFNNTECPGNEFYKALPEIRKATHDKILTIKKSLAEPKQDSPSIRQPKIVFFMPPKAYSTSRVSKKLVIGNLYMRKSDGGLLIMKATSGQPGYQHINRIWVADKGPMPPSRVVDGGYWLNLNWEEPVENRFGLGDRFYPILPNEVRHSEYPEDGDKVRKHLGLHLDNNYDQWPGSAGCLVVSPNQEPGWKELEEELDKLKDNGYDKIPVYVYYR